MPDKFSALWISHSSMSDFIECPRCYYLRAIYKDKRNNHKVTLMQPPLALGQVVHDVLDCLSTIPVEERFLVSLEKRLEEGWRKVEGKLGGFKTREEELEYKERALAMLRRIQENPGPLKNKAVKIKCEGNLPQYYFSEEENIILCGKVDWLEYIESDDSVHIVDFKTGKHDEDEDSLQLPIYCLLVKNCQKRKTSKASYWYIDRDSEPKEVPLPDLDSSMEKIMDVAKRMKLAKQIQRFKCPKDGCYKCRGLERIVNGEGIKVGESEYRQDIYILP